MSNSHMAHATLAIILSFAGLSACADVPRQGGDGNDGHEGGAGDGSNTATDASTGSGSGGSDAAHPLEGDAGVYAGDCKAACEQAVALRCPAYHNDVATCTEECMRQGACTEELGLAPQFLEYLRCIEEEGMSCSPNLGTPSPGECGLVANSIWDCIY